MNWYNVKTLQVIGEPFVSTVDSGNFIAYMFVLKEYLKESKAKNEKVQLAYEVASQIIENTDFSKLYAYDKNLFSIGFNITENKLIDSYYDLLASEARTASFVAIAKKDISYKHWFYLGRTTTKLKQKEGLVSWSGTAFEYLMPNIVMPTYKKSLIDNANEFCIYAQKEYSKKQGIPWGISESAYNIKDLNYNYQYKAFGIPWIGLKRGLEDDLVVAPYATALALEKDFESAYSNLETLQAYGAFSEYGFFESIDFTPSRNVNQNYELVKTHMAHHQALILISINNLLNKNILKKYFSKNVEIMATEILLQEKISKQNVILENRNNKIKKLKHVDEFGCMEKVIHKPSKNVNILNNEKYFLFINDFGEGYSQVDNVYISKYKKEVAISNIIYIKNMRSGEFWSSTYLPTKKVPNKYEVRFAPYQAQFLRKDNGIETSTKIMVSAEDNVEVRKLRIKNTTNESLEMKTMLYLDVLLSSKDSYIAHPAYNGMFLSMSEYENAVVIKRKTLEGNVMYSAVFSSCEKNIKFQKYTDKMQILGRCGTIKNPKILDEDVCESRVENTVTPAVAIISDFRLEGNESISMDFYICYADTEEEIIRLIEKYNAIEEERILKLAMSRSIIENRFYGIKPSDNNKYNLLLSKLVFKSNDKKEEIEYVQSELWRFGISGDLPITVAKIKSVKDIFCIKELINAVEYFSFKKVKMDLVIILEESQKELYIENKIRDYIYSKNIGYLLNTHGGIYLLNKNLISNREEKIFDTCAQVFIDASKGSLEEQLEGGANV